MTKQNRKHKSQSKRVKVKNTKHTGNQRKYECKTKKCIMHKDK